MSTIHSYPIITVVKTTLDKLQFYTKEINNLFISFFYTATIIVFHERLAQSPFRFRNPHWILYL